LSFNFYLCQGYVFARLCLSVCVCVCVCVQDNSKSYGRILLKFWGYVGHGISYKWLNFGGDLAGILDSGSLWNFRYHCIKGDIREPLAKRQCIQSQFLGHVELGHCGKCNYSWKCVGEIYITIWQALGGGVRATTAFLVYLLKAWHCFSLSSASSNLPIYVHWNSTSSLYEGHLKSFRHWHIRQQYFPQSIH